MKRDISIFLLFFLFTIKGSGQLDIRGIALCDLSPFRKGDTISIKGYSYDITSDTEKYLVKSDNVERVVPASYIRLLDNDFGFWTRIWYKNRLSAISKNGWQDDRREVLFEDFRNYISAMEEHDLIYKDDYLENYLQSLAMAIHPECFIKPDNKPLEIIIIKSVIPEVYAFDHGTIVISTGIIAETDSEEELALILSENIAHIVLEDNLENLNNNLNTNNAFLFSAVLFSVASDIVMGVHNTRSNYKFTLGDMLSVWELPLTIAEGMIRRPSDSYTSLQMERSREIAQGCINNLISENYTFRTCQEYGLVISSVVRDCAWDEYFRENYNISCELVDKLINLDIDDEEDWLLKAKNYLELQDNRESNLQALEFIETAQQMDQYHLAEVLLVKGIILMRLERLDEAREVLNEFISASVNFYFRVLPRSFFFLALHYGNPSSGNVNELAEDIVYNKKYNTYCRIIFLQ
jgi:beta-barrel assembly-enhancing protease